MKSYKLCALVIIGGTARGKKRFLALEDGVRPPKVGERFCLTSNALV